MDHDHEHTTVVAANAKKDGFLWIPPNALLGGVGYQIACCFSTNTIMSVATL
jgi:hypothetical protein